jgi:hypothetical protein
VALGVVPHVVLTVRAETVALGVVPHVVLTVRAETVALGVVPGVVLNVGAETVALGVVAADVASWVLFRHGVPSFLLPGLPPGKTDCVSLPASKVAVSRLADIAAVG